MRVVERARAREHDVIRPCLQCTRRPLTLQATMYSSPATIRPPPTFKFYLVTSWVLFLEGLSGISGLAVSYFYKNTLKVDPSTLTQVIRPRANERVRGEH